MNNQDIDMCRHLDAFEHDLQELNKVSTYLYESSDQDNMDTLSLIVSNHIDSIKEILALMNATTMNTKYIKAPLQTQSAKQKHDKLLANKVQETIMLDEMIRQTKRQINQIADNRFSSHGLHDGGFYPSTNDLVLVFSQYPYELETYHANVTQSLIRQPHVPEPYVFAPKLHTLQPNLSQVLTSQHLAVEDLDSCIKHNDDLFFGKIEQTMSIREYQTKITDMIVAGHFNIARYLLKDVFSTGQHMSVIWAEVLRYAVGYNSPGIVKMLLEWTYGDKIIAHDMGIFAQDSGFTEIYQMLLEY